MPKKVFVAFGTRPEAIKMGPVVDELRKRDGIECTVCVTGQHREMLDQALSAFHIKPDYSLGLMREGQSLSELTSALINSVSKAMAKEKPDIALVHGDTATAFSAALAAFYLGVPVAHVEAGLRTYKLDSPFPEEFFRQAASLIAILHFAPTEGARQNLLREAKSPSSVIVTGNTAIDALRYTVKEGYSHPELVKAGDRRIVLLTAHRRESWGEGLNSVFRAVRRLVEEDEGIYVIYPVHPNPIIRGPAVEILSGLSRVSLIEPLGPIDFHNFLKKAYIVLTDSGGIQEEAAALKKPTIVLRDLTERPEGLEAGVLKLAGTGEEGIFSAASSLLADRGEYIKMASSPNPFGDGFASVRIANKIQEVLAGKCDAAR